LARKAITFYRGCQLPNIHVQATIAVVESPSQPAAPAAENPFRRGALVIVTLGNPRAKFWGALLALGLEGLSLCGAELDSFDDLIAMIKDGDPFSPSVVFFPMHRVERMELDQSSSGIPSLAQRFAAKTGLDPASVLAVPRPAHSAIREERP